MVTQTEIADTNSDKFTFAYLYWFALLLVPYVGMDIAEKIFLHKSTLASMAMDFLYILPLFCFGGMFCIVKLGFYLWKNQWRKSTSLIFSLASVLIFLRILPFLFLPYFYFQVMQLPIHHGEPRYASFYWDEGGGFGNGDWLDGLIYDESDKILSKSQGDDKKDGYCFTVHKFIGHFYLTYMGPC